MDNQAGSFKFDYVCMDLFPVKNVSGYKSIQRINLGFFRYDNLLHLFVSDGWNEKRRFRSFENTF